MTHVTCRLTAKNRDQVGGTTTLATYRSATQQRACCFDRITVISAATSRLLCRPNTSNRDIRYDTIRYDTIRDAISTCAQKPTRVSLIYRTEPTTKSVKTEKNLKVKNQICSEITVNSPGNTRSKYLSGRKEGLQWEGFAEK